MFFVYITKYLGKKNVFFTIKRVNLFLGHLRTFIQKHYLCPKENRNIMNYRLLKRATLSDLDTLFELMISFYQHFDYPFEPVKHKQVVQYFLENEHLGSIWLILQDQKPVGYIALAYGFSFEFLGRDAFIDEFFIIESHRNLKLGSRAIQCLQQKMNEFGLVALHLQTENHNQRAKGLYESLGFKDLKRSTLTWICS